MKMKFIEILDTYSTTYLPTNRIISLEMQRREIVSKRFEYLVVTLSCEFETSYILYCTAHNAFGEDMMKWIKEWFVYEDYATSALRLHTYDYFHQKEDLQEREI